MDQQMAHREKHGVATLPRSWRKSWIIARIVATPSWFDSASAAAVYQRAAELTASTGVRHVVDHIIPLQHPLVCGLHWHENLQAVPEKVNAAKSNKFFIDQLELDLR